MRKWFAKRPAVSFYVLTLTLSRGYWLTLLALGLRVGPGSVSHFPGLLGPMLAAIAVIAVIGGRKALLELFGRMFLLGRIGLPSWFWRCRLNKSMAALVGPVLIGWLFALVCGAFVLAQV